MSDRPFWIRTTLPFQRLCRQHQENGWLICICWRVNDWLRLVFLLSLAVSIVPSVMPRAFTPIVEMVRLAA